MIVRPFLALLALASPAFAGDLASLCADRTAIERVYYNHRLGNKPPFEQVSPPSLIEKMVKSDLSKKAALKKIYAVDISPSMLRAEVDRIDATTRAPETLAELKAALANDTNRFATAVAEPIIVDRLLRDRFENDDNLHADRRRELEKVRERLLAARVTDGSVTNLLRLLKEGHASEATESVWELGPRPAAKKPAATADEIEIRKRFGPDAQLLSSPTAADSDRKQYFEDLPPDLQKVLRAQLLAVGDVSALIEMPNGFVLYLCKEATPAALSVAVLSLRKRNYEEWLAQQTPNLP